MVSVPQFPLFEQLRRSEDPCILDVSDLCSTINELPKYHGEIIYMLILHHYVLEHGEIDGFNDLSFFHKQRRKNIQYDGVLRVGEVPFFKFEKFPQSLQVIICRYVQVITGTKQSSFVDLD
jgi:hypothetical protein